MSRVFKHGPGLASVQQLFLLPTRASGCLHSPVTGTIVNAAAILGGGLVGLWRKKPLSPSFESWLKVSVSALLVFYGLRLCWVSLSGSLWRIFMQIFTGIAALMFGRLVGKALGLQKKSNTIGQMARRKLAGAAPKGSRGTDSRFSEGFKVSSALFCAAPLAILGALQDGLSDYYYPLIIKAVIEGLAALGFAMLFGAGVLLAALPVVAMQGSITLVCMQYIVPWLERHNGGEVRDHVNFVGGLLVFCVALIILGLKKIEVADYLPALVIAAIFGWFMR